MIGPLLLVVAARPNFMKMAPVIHEIRRRGIPNLVIHTGQHYDIEMSRVFLEELGLPKPDRDFGVGSGSHAEQTGRVMVAFERTIQETLPRLAVVAGDVNSTLACALSAAKQLLPVAHVEAGLRSFDRTMPEEINRLLTDHLSDLLFATERSAIDNLQREGVPASKIHFVGNTMIDSLTAHLPTAREREPWKRFGFAPGEYGVVTLHRPANVDLSTKAEALWQALAAIAEKLPLVFPVHPRARKSFEIAPGRANLQLVKPLGYIDFLGLLSAARLVLSDSGGIQEETTALGVPCLTLRDNTERPVTVSVGTNRVIGTEPDRICSEALQLLASQPRQGGLPELWDGCAAGRVVDVLEAWLARSP